MSLTLKRPKRIGEEDEEDLIRFQEEFLRNKNEQPAAKVIKKQQKSEDTIENEKQNDQPIKKNKIEIDFDADNQALATVLTEIIEKPIVKDWCEKNQANNFQKDQIPKIEKLNLAELNKDLPAERRKNKSLFAQNLERQGKLKSHFSLNKVYQPDSLRQNEQIKLIEQQLSNKPSPTGQTEHHQLITGEGLGNKKDVEQIHLENLEILSKMKPDEILAEQQKLMQQIDPKILSFIRRKNLKTEHQAQGFMNLSKPEASNRLTDEEVLEQLSFKPNKKWLHMDKIEYDKLEWMLKPKNAIKTESDLGTSSSARFDFSGCLISPEEDVPSHKALHHHGNEPEQAGYTLDELFHLARSKFNQQKVLALQTLGNILKKCHSGDYNEVIKSGEEPDDTSENDKNNLLNQLIEGGVLFLLRLSLDDQTESIINASLNAIANLVQPECQEDTFDYMFDLHKGYETPCLHPFSAMFEQKKQKFSVDKNLNLNEQKDLDELTDDEFIRHDLIRGLFRMNLMERVFYLFNKYQPTLTSNQIQHSVFMILFRCMRHSPELCYDFTEKYSTLLDLIVSKFLPSYIEFVDEVNKESMLINISFSLKLMRLLSSAGPSIANRLYKKYDLNQKLMNYLTIDKYIKDSSLSEGILKVQTESIRLLKTLILYAENDMGIECMIDVYEILITHLNKSIGHKSNENQCFLKALISLFDCLVQTVTENDPNSEFKSDIGSSVYSIVSTFTIKQFSLVNSNNLDQFDLNLVSVSLDYLVCYLEKIECFNEANKADVLSKKLRFIEILIENILEPITNSTEKINQLRFDQLVMSKLLSSSTSSNSGEIHKNFKKIYTNNLTYLPTILNIDFSKNGPFCFLASFLRMFNLCFKNRMKMIDDKKFTNTRLFLQNPYLKSYLKAYEKNNSQSKDSTNNSYFIMKFENHVVYQCLKLAFGVFNFEDEEEKNSLDASEAEKNTEEKRAFYLLALSLVIKLKSGDEYFLHDILATCLFNMNFWSLYLLPSTADNNLKDTSNFLVKYFEKMQLNDDNSSPQIEFSYLNINYGQSETIRLNKNFINTLESCHIYETLNQIKFTYLDNQGLLNTRLLEHSRHLNFASSTKSSQIKNLYSSNFYSNKFLLRPDWIYMPIMSQVALIQAQLNPENSEKSDTNNSKLISTLSNCLKFIYLIENYFGSDYLDLNVNYTLRYVRLLYVYLFDSEVFLDKQILTLMYMMFFKYSKDKKQPLQNLNLGQKIEEIMSFYDFYQYLLTHYDSTSFGDYLFSLYLIVPLQQCYPVKYRQLFWSDFPHLFKYMRFDSDKTKLLISLSNFVQPNEKNLHMIRLYSQVLLDSNDFRLVSQSKLAYGILVANLNSFVFEHINKLEHKVEFDFKKLMVKQFLCLNDKLKNHLIYYKCINPSTDNIETYDELPTIRKQWLSLLSE